MRRMQSASEHETQIRRCAQAFTRIELLVSIGTLIALLAVVLPGFATAKSRNEQIVCANNLRHIGGALQWWASDHDDLHPWAAEEIAGGNRNPSGAAITVPGVGDYPTGLRGNIWLQFAWVREELGTAKVLVCPSDSTRRVATGFKNTPGGLASLGFQNNAVSYFLGMHTWPTMAATIVAGDRSMTYEGQTSFCSLQIGLLKYVDPQTTNSLTWRQQPNMHPNSGNLLFRSGAVEQTFNFGLNAAIKAIPDSSLHLIYP
jgi:type II secretory pathway pseudopilin PulG